MNKFQKIIFLIGLMSLGVKTQAQIEPMYGMYRFNALAINPAQAGANKSIDLSLLSRWPLRVLQKLMSHLSICLSDKTWVLE
jgi:hypothetical protein